MYRFVWALLPFATVALAQGCGPTRLKVAESVTLDLPPIKAWEIVGNFQDVSWDADAIATRGSGGNQPDKAVRTVTLKGGAALGESLYKYDADAMSYSYHIDTTDMARLPVQNASMTIEIAPDISTAKSIVRWKSAFYRSLKPDEGAPDVADGNAVAAMKSYLRDGLQGLKAKAGAKS